MRILVVSDGGLGQGFAQRCEKDGHDVKIGKLEPETWLPDLVIYDSNNLDAEKTRQAGFKVLGSSRWSSTVEEDQTYFTQLATSVGWNCNGFKQGTHLYISAWFNGATFISTYTSIVYRRFMPGGAGPDLACTGVLSSFEPVTAQVEHIFLAPLEKVLKKVNHRGVVHLHTMVNGPQWCIKEIFTCLANPISLPFFEISQRTVSEVLLDLFDETSHPIRPMDKWASAIQISIPPYPYNYSANYVPVDGVVSGNLKHLWLGDVDYHDGKCLSRGLVGYITARGDSVFECVRRMYRTLGNIKAADLQYRNDVGKNVQSLLTSLQQGGWIN